MLSIDPTGTLDLQEAYLKDMELDRTLNNLIRANEAIDVLLEELNQDKPTHNEKRAN